MYEYLLKIIGLIIFSILIGVIIPRGEMRKYILGIMSLITLCVIISPIPSFFSKSEELLNIDNIELNVDEFFIEDIQLTSDEYLKKSIENYLSEEGIVSTVVIVKNTRNINETDYINVILEDVSLSEEDKNIIVSKVKENISEKFNLNCRVRVFYER